MHHEAETPGEKHTAESDEERGQLEKVDQGPHQSPKPGAEEERDCQGGERRNAVGNELGDQDAGEGDQGANREIDAAREDDEGRAHRGDAEEGIVAEKIDEDAQRAEAGKQQAAGGIEEDEDRQGGGDRDLLLGQAPFHEARRGRRRATRARKLGDCRRQAPRITSAFGTVATSALTLRA